VRIKLLLAVCAACGQSSAVNDRPCEWIDREAFFLPATRQCRDVLYDADPRPAACERDAEYGAAPRLAYGEGATLRAWLVVPRGDAEVQIATALMRDSHCSRAQAYPTEGIQPYGVSVLFDDNARRFEVIWSGAEGTYAAYHRADTGGLVGGRTVPLSVGLDGTPARWYIGRDRRVAIFTSLPSTEDGAFETRVALFNAVFEPLGEINLPEHTLAFADAAILEDRIAIAWGSGDITVGGVGFYSLNDLTPLSQPLILDSPRAFLDPRIVWAGNEFIVVWWTNGDPPRVHAAAVSEAGLLLPPVVDLAEGKVPVVATDGKRHFILHGSGPGAGEAGYCGGSLRAGILSGWPLSVTSSEIIGSSAFEVLRISADAYSVVRTDEGFEIATTAGVAYTPETFPVVISACVSPMFIRVPDGSVNGPTEIPAMLPADAGVAP